MKNPSSAEVKTEQMTLLLFSRKTTGKSFEFLSFCFFLHFSVGNVVCLEQIEQMRSADRTASFAKEELTGSSPVQIQEQYNKTTNVHTLSTIASGLGAEARFAPDSSSFICPRGTQYTLPTTCILPFIPAEHTERSLPSSVPTHQANALHCLDTDRLIGPCPHGDGAGWTSQDDRAQIGDTK